MKDWLKLLRIKNYIKNFLVWIPLLCSGQLLRTGKLLAILAGFLAFCLLSSVVYIINDIMDVDKDRNHPTKCKRPIASGAVSIRLAWILVVVLFVLSMLCNLTVFSISGLTILILYLCINLAYSFGLKNYPILDLTLLTLGHLARMLYGSVVTDSSISPWILLTVVCMVIFFTLDKRRNELREIHDGSTRKVLNFYTISFIDKVEPVCITLTIIFYSLWCRDELTLALHLGKYLIYTVPLMILIFIKCLMLMDNSSEKDPIDVYLHDLTFLVLFSILFGSFIILLSF